jgi:hypothetical protein
MYITLLLYDNMHGKELTLKNGSSFTFCTLPVPPFNLVFGSFSKSSETNSAALTKNHGGMHGV